VLLSPPQEYRANEANQKDYTSGKLKQL